MPVPDTVHELHFYQDIQSAANNIITFTYRGNGNTGGSVPSNHSVSTPGLITVHHPINLTRPGYVFGGWRNGNHIFQPGHTVYYGAGSAGTVVFYAHWVGPLTFHYRSVGHTSGTLPPSHFVFAPAPISLAGNPGNLTRPGYFFGGWRHSGGGVWQAGFEFVYAAGTQGAITFYANWVRTPAGIVNIPYEIYLSSNMPNQQAGQSMNQVKSAFLNTFGINFVWQRTLLTSSLNPRVTNVPCVAPHLQGLCTPRCGVAANGSDCLERHHRSAWHFLNRRYASSGNVRVFRFVGNDICFHDGAQHRRVNGLAHRLGRDAIISARPWYGGLPLGTTAHELSHILGTHDHRCTGGQLCVMSVSWMVHNLWCQGCRATIMDYRDRLPRMANDFVAFHDEGSLTYSPIADEITFFSVDDFVDSYNAAQAGRMADDMAMIAESVNLIGLERLYTPTNIPHEYQFYRMIINEDSVTLLYLHYDDMVSEYTSWDALIHQRNFQFTFTRWDTESPMAGILAQTDSTEVDLINGRYLFVEPNMFIWESGNEVIYMYVPLNPRVNAVSVRGNGNDGGFEWTDALGDMHITETSIIDLSSVDRSSFRR